MVAARSGSGIAPSPRTSPPIRTARETWCASSRCSATYALSVPGAAPSGGDASLRSTPAGLKYIWLRGTETGSRLTFVAADPGSAMPEPVPAGRAQVRAEVGQPATEDGVDVAVHQAICRAWFALHGSALLDVPRENRNRCKTPDSGQSR